MTIDEYLINFLDCDIPGFYITVKKNMCEDHTFYYINLPIYYFKPGAISPVSHPIAIVHAILQLPRKARP